MLKFINLIILFFFLSTFANAEIVKNIQINGNNRVSDETIKIYGGIKLNKNYNENDLNTVLKKLYETDFFENINLKIDNNILTINLDEYPFINQLIIDGEKSNRIKNEIKKAIRSKNKRSLIKSNLAKDIEIIKLLYSSLGYNTSKVEAKLKKIDDNNFDLLFQINRGTKTKISTIKFLGNNNIRSKRLRDVIASEEDKFWKFISRNTNLSENLINLDLRLLKNYYKSLGFYDIKISSNIAKINKIGNADLVYTINEGQRYTLNKISTNIDNVFDKKLFFKLNKTYKKYIGEYYSPFKIKNMLEELDEIIENNNLQFVEHNVEEIIENESINIVFNISEGEKTLIERVNIIGNSITNESVVRGELLVDEGDPFSNLSLSKSISKLKALRIFGDVESKITDSEVKNQKKILINVEEKPTGEISAGAGVGSSGGSFGFVISENNWLGTGNKVNFELDVDAESIGGQFNFTNNNYNFTGNKLNYYIGTESNDKPNQGYENTIISSGVNTSFEQFKNIYLNLGLEASFDDLRADSSASSTLKKQAENLARSLEHMDSFLIKETGHSCLQVVQ
jgi:outer membrane protein insertion porin family